MPLKVLDINAPVPILALLYGYSGAGKTSFALSCPRTIFLASERAAVMAAVQDHIRRGGASPFRVLEPTTRDDVFEFCDDLEKPAMRSQIDTVVFDSFTDIQNRFLLQATSDRVDAAIAAKRSNPGSKDQPEQQDWQRVLMPGLRLLIRLQNLGYNVIVTAHVRDWIDPIDRPRVRALMASRRNADPNMIPKKYYPAARGQIQDTLPHYFNLCAFMRKEPNGTRRMYTREQATFFAKTQFGGLPDVIENPTYERIMLGINGQLTEALITQPNPWAELNLLPEGEENAIVLEPGE